ncbi:TPA: helix-turn-helix domain-containing protein [Enterobacter asburiae]
MLSLGERIRELREKSNLSHEELASLCGWSSSIRVKRYESGNNIISIEDAISLAHVLGTSPSSFMSENCGDLEFVRYRSTTVPVVGHIDCENIHLNGYTLSPSGAHSIQTRDEIFSYRLYSFKVTSSDLAPIFKENELIVIDSQSYPLTNDLVVVKNLFKDLVIKRFVGHENGKFEIINILKPHIDYCESFQSPTFVLGVYIGSIIKD